MNKRCINAQKKAKDLKCKYKTFDPFKLCRHLEIKVMFEDLGHVLGFYQTAYGIRIIHINSKISQKQKRVACAHELGHAILHYNENKIFVDKNYFTNCGQLEMEANLFMIELLLLNTTPKDLSVFKGAALEIIEKSMNITGKHFGTKYRENLRSNITKYIPEDILDNKLIILNKQL